MQDYHQCSTLLALTTSITVIFILLPNSVESQKEPYGELGDLAEETTEPLSKPVKSCFLDLKILRSSSGMFDLYFSQKKKPEANVFGQVIVRHLTGKEPNRSMGVRGPSKLMWKNTPLATNEQLQHNSCPQRHLTCAGTVAGTFQANLKVRSCFCYIYQFEAPCKRNVFLPTVLRYDQIPFQKITEVLFLTILTT